VSSVGTLSFGVVTPKIFEGDNVAKIIATSAFAALKELGMTPSPNDVIATTESVVAIAQGNVIPLDLIGQDVRTKTGGGTVALINPIGSRNRMSHIIAGFAKGVEKLIVVFGFPEDEQGNCMVDRKKFEQLRYKNDKDGNRIIDPAKVYTPEEIETIMGEKLKHSVTGQDYARIYQQISPNIQVLFALKPAVVAANIAPVVIAGDVHTRFQTEDTLRFFGAKKIFRLDHFMNKSIGGSGYNSVYGLLGANLHGTTKAKLFPEPENGNQFLRDLQDEFAKLSGGVRPEALIYGDGAYHDPETNINELCDPTTAPSFTPRLDGAFNEVKIKHKLAVYLEQGMSHDDAIAALNAEVANKTANMQQAGTTPRRFYNLLATAADLITGSGDKGTPVVYFKGYFNGRALKDGE
jgi:hypothetical protein